MFNALSLCNGLILDIRDNGGGNVETAEKIASRFTDERVLTGYSCYKNGPGHNDFSKWEENWLEPDKYNSTGGGGGFPFTSELPNGWTVRFSSAPTFDASGNHIEMGIAPDIKLDMKEADFKAGIDTYIEYARKLINEQIVNP